MNGGILEFVNDCLTGKMITNGEVLEFIAGKISKC